MYPIRLNLLPPAKRTYLERLVFGECIKNITESFIVFLAAAGILLLGADWVLQNYFTTLAADLTIISSQQAHKSTELKRVNRILRETEQLQLAYQPWAETLSRFGTLIPHGVTISEWTLSHTQKSFTISGTAATRDILLAFKKNLESDIAIATVEFPPSLLTDKTQVNFSITAAFKD